MALGPFLFRAIALRRCRIRRQIRQLRLERTAQHDVGTATGHVGGDGDRARPAGLRDDVRFALVLLGVEYFVRDLFLLQQIRQELRRFDRGRADQHRLAALVAVLDVLDHRFPFEALLEEDNVLVVLAHHRLVGRDDDHFQAVDLMELVGFRIRRAGHAGQLLVHAEIVLERDRGKPSGFRAGSARLLRLDRLVQTIGPAPSGQRAAGEFVDDDHLAVAHDVFLIAVIQRIGAQRGIQVMHDCQVLRVVQAFVRSDDVLTAQHLLGVLHAGFGQVHLLLLFVDEIVAAARLPFPGASASARCG